jgi:nucleotide-binding universal stress UspA family protein
MTTHDNPLAAHDEHPWQLRRIVVGLDGSADSARAADYAADLARRTSATIIAAHAIGLLEHLTRNNDLVRRDVSQAWVEPFRRRHVPFEIQIVDGPAPESVAALAEAAGADLVVVGTRGAGNAVGVLGSTAAQIVALSTVPVLVVPPRREGVPA